MRISNAAQRTVSLDFLTPNPAPFYSEGELRFCTKAGVTDTGEFAEQYVKSAPYPYAEFSKEWIAKGYTPIFEFCSPHQQIVLEYQNDSMHLLALRNMETGEYISYEETKLIAEKANIPVRILFVLACLALTLFYLFKHDYNSIDC